MNYYLVSPIKIVRSDAQSFTYSFQDKLNIGTVVVVPVGKSEIVGVVIAKVDRPDFKVKPIAKIVTENPLPSALVETALWMSKYYRTHLATVWQTVLPRGLTKKRRDATSSVATPDVASNRTNNLFTKQQTSALKKIDQTSSGTVLLHGITGSGKTLVYIEAAKKVIAKSGSVIVLVPEIALTSQLVSEFSGHFDNVLLTHSRQTEAERHKVWLSALNADQPQVVIGPRSALFMPVKNLGLVVIDECHEPTFKQESSPRYSALRTGAILAKNHQAKLILGSATPNISDYYQAKKSNRPIITMDQPARSDTVKPSVELVDMTKRDNFIKHRFLSNQLISQLESTFADKQQALIFHNRRGTAQITLCQNCGWQAGCGRCFIPLTLHADQHKLSCHICNSQSKVPTSCPECQNVDIIHKGIGTKQIESELKKLFPDKNIVRFDGDTNPKHTVDKRYNELKDGSIDLIIGTQVIAKGLDLPHLRTVGVIQADAGLSLPDFAAAERTFQLLAQVIGRVGRSHHPTKVIVQSYQPDHPAIQDGLTQNYDDFYQRTIRQRRATNFPPFTHLLKLVCSYKTEAAAIRNAKQLADKLKLSAAKDVQILGPTPAFYERVRDSYRWQLVIKSPRRSDLIELLSHLPPSHWQFELDPSSLL